MLRIAGTIVVSMALIACQPSSSNQQKALAPFIVELQPVADIKIDESNEFLATVQTSKDLTHAEFVLETAPDLDRCWGDTKWQGKINTKKKITLKFSCYISSKKPILLQAAVHAQVAGLTMTNAGRYEQLAPTSRSLTDKKEDFRITTGAKGTVREYELP